MGLGVAASFTPSPFLCPPSSPSSFPHFHLRCPLRFPTVTSRKTLLLFIAPASARRRQESGGAATSDDEGDGWLKEEAAAEAEADEELPLEEMRRWLRNKPTGFGEGKTYDTAVEEKLLEEFEQTRKAQLSIADKARKEPKKPEPVKKEVEVPSSICVRVGNLPRKKNIHRDLQLAFKGFIGIVNISPAVMGNQKTRDPICKGLAFLYLESEEVAFRFVHKYSKQNVLFGKVEKQITCDIINPTEQLARDRTLSNQSRLAKLAMDTPVRSEIKNLSQDSQVSEGLTGLSEDDHTEGESRIEGTETAIEYDSDLSLDATVNGGDFDSNESISSSQKPRKQAASRKKKVKTKSVKNQKSSFSGSMARLKMKERTVLTGVFSKYGGKVPQDLAKQS